MKTAPSKTRYIYQTKVGYSMNAKQAAVKMGNPLTTTEATMVQKAKLDKFIHEFESAFGHASISCTVDYFHDRPETYSGLIVSGEGDENTMSGIPAFDTYEESDHLMADAAVEFGHEPLPKSYDGGILNEARAWLKAHGAHAEFWDAGTVEIWTWVDDDTEGDD